jgi:hypothetical protein
VVKREHTIPFIPDEYDQGYFAVFDPYRQRQLYVCTFDVGTDPSFLAAMHITSVLDVSKEAEEHFDQQTTGRRERTLNGIVFCIKMLIESAGDIVIHCRNGRTRSPMIVAAYFMIVSCMSKADAYSALTASFLDQRPHFRDEGIDRLNRYGGHLQMLLHRVDNGS